VRGRQPEHQAKQKIALELTDELYQSAKAKASREGRPLTVVIRTALEQYVLTGEHSGILDGGPSES
jgi:predicted DNA binding CopG/RHH family protein